MLVIGERLNVLASKKVRAMVEARDATALLAEARAQVAAGAMALDVHCPDVEGQRWMLEQAASLNVPLSLDNPDAGIIRECLRMRNVKFLNSITSERLDLFKDAAEAGVEVIALLHNTDLEDVRKAANKHRFPLSRIFFDPAIVPLSVDAANGPRLLRVHETLKKEHGVRTIVGLSNVSYGLPRTLEVRAATLISLMEGGLDAAILNPLELIWFVRAHKMLHDQSGKEMMAYIKAFKAEGGAKR
jgi:5-methyltetrahydrofolate--homocysteine methyltransferase